MMNWVRVALGALAVAGCQGVLGIEEWTPKATGADAGSECLRKSDCADGLACLFKTCGEECARNTDCAQAGTECLQVGAVRVCVAPSRAACGAGEGCPEGTTCTGGVCRADCDGTANACPGGQRCSGGVCVSVTPDAGSGGASGGGGSPGTGGMQGSGGAEPDASVGGTDGGVDASVSAGGAVGAGGGDGGTTVPECRGKSAGEGACREKERFTCGAGLVTREDVEICAGGCVDGVCTECHLGDSKCDGPASVLCGASGEWEGSGTACLFVCNAATGECDGECVPEGRECKSGTQVPRYCDTAGRWQDEVACSVACVSGDCVGCTPGEQRCSSNRVQSCNASGAWVDATGNCTTQSQTCVQSGNSAACAGECAPGQQQCSSNRVQSCSVTGTWPNGTTCTTSDQTCVESGLAAACTGICTAGTQGCNGTLSRTCGGAGQWGAGSVVVGQCGAICTPGNTSCSGSLYRTCDATGKWPTGTAIAGQCGAICTPGQTQCSGNGVQTCNASGQWGAASACATNRTCIAATGACGGVCGPGQTQCSGNGVQTCNASGQWGTAATCAANRTCIAATGVCGGVCGPGQTQCSGNGVQTCSASGQYGSAVPCTDETCLGPSGSASCQGVCAPGQVQCSGNGVQTCNATSGQYGSVTACVSAAPQCAGGACGPPPSCQSLTANCGPSSNESCCTSARVTGAAYNRINNASYPATVADFRLDKFEVTVGRWRKFVAAWNANWRPNAGVGKHGHLNDGSGLTSSYTDGGYEPGWNTTWASSVDTSDSARQVGGTWATWTASSGTTENRPINYVNWYESQAFCIWDGGFLPSEAEWNYAAAGGTLQREYPWGATAPSCALANFFGGSGGSSECYPSTYTTNVGVLNGNGIYGQSDLAGNLWEWSLDWHATTATAFVAACTNCAYLPSSASNRVQRGGAFNAAATSLATSYRNGGSPAGRSNNVGLRCARAP